MMKYALILCGGKASRFNHRNKALLPYAQDVFLQKILNELASFTVFLSANDKTPYASFNQKIIADPYENIGPIAGITGGLQQIEQNSWLFVTACDMPHIRASFVTYLQEFLSNDYQVIVPKDRQGQIHPLCGFYHHSVLGIARGQIQKKNYKMHDLIQNCRRKIVDLSYTIFEDAILDNINCAQDYEAKINTPKVLAVCGVKNSGKTTLISKIIQRLRQQNYSVATIKHTSHDYPFDMENTDTYKHKQAGACAVCIYSPYRKMLVQDDKQIKIEDLIQAFSLYDIILLEGFKDSNFPKIEVIRKEISCEISSNKENLKAVITDHEQTIYHTQIACDDIDSIIENFILCKGEMKRCSTYKD